MRNVLTAFMRAGLICAVSGGCKKKVEQPYVQRTNIASNAQEGAS